jgi:hypothetical protein
MLKIISYPALALLCSVTAMAQTPAQDIIGGRSDYLNLQISEQENVRLAAAEGELGGGPPVAEPAVAEGPLYRDRWFTANKVHKYAGIGSIALAILTGLAPKEYDGLHEQAARGALALGVVALSTGLVFHYDDLSASNFTSNPDNLHAMLTTLGVLGFATAVDKGGETGHAEAGVAGAALMLLGIKMTW